MGLTDDCRCSACPIRVVELEPERDVESETHRSPQPQPKEQRWAGLENAGCIIDPARDRAGLCRRWLSAGHQREPSRNLGCRDSMLLLPDVMRKHTILFRRHARKRLMRARLCTCFTCFIRSRSGDGAAYGWLFPIGVPASIRNCEYHKKRCHVNRIARRTCDGEQRGRRKPQLLRIWVTTAATSASVMLCYFTAAAAVSAISTSLVLSKPLTPTAPTTVPPLWIGTPPCICIRSTVIAAGRPVLIVASSAWVGS